MEGTAPPTKNDPGVGVVSGFRLVDLSEANTNKWSTLVEQIKRAQLGLCPPESGTAEKYRAVTALRQRQARLDEAAIRSMIADYRIGATVYELADRFGCNRNTVSCHLRSHGIRMRRSPLSEETIHEAIRLYESGLSLFKVGELVEAKPETVRLRLIERGVRMRDSHGRERQA